MNSARRVPPATRTARARPSARRLRRRRLRSRGRFARPPPARSPGPGRPGPAGRCSSRFLAPHAGTEDRWEPCGRPAPSGGPDGESGLLRGVEGVRRRRRRPGRLCPAERRRWRRTCRLSSGLRPPRRVPHLGGRAGCGSGCAPSPHDAVRRPPGEVGEGHPREGGRRLALAHSVGRTARGRGSRPVDAHRASSRCGRRVALPTRQAA
jgi:hypothetical protein